MKRELYVAPVAELVEVSMECGVLAGSPGIIQDNGQLPGLDNEEDWTSIW